MINSPIPTSLDTSSRLTIQQAAEFLKVSTKTLRRWEKQGLIAPDRTIGNQRRYNLYQLQSIGKTKYKQVISHPQFAAVSTPQQTASSPRHRFAPRTWLTSGFVTLAILLISALTYHQGQAFVDSASKLVRSS